MNLHVENPAQRVGHVPVLNIHINLLLDVKQLFKIIIIIRKTQLNVNFNTSSAYGGSIVHVFENYMLLTPTSLGQHTLGRYEREPTEHAESLWDCCVIGNHITFLFLHHVHKANKQLCAFHIYIIPLKKIGQVGTDSFSFYHIFFYSESIMSVVCGTFTVQKKLPQKI